MPRWGTGAELRLSARNHLGTFSGPSCRLPPDAEYAAFDPLNRTYSSHFHTHVLAPLERLDEAAAVVMHKAGFLQPTGYERFAPGPTSGAWSRRKAQLPVQASGDFCAAGPRLRACEAAVLAAAPDDHRLYQLAVERFAAQVASLRGVPTFARTLEAHFAAVAAVGQAAAGR